MGIFLLLLFQGDTGKAPHSSSLYNLGSQWDGNANGHVMEGMGCMGRRKDP